jgi:hypothetical protein
MTTYGGECGGGTFTLYEGIYIVGNYSSPVDVTETYLGEPYIRWENVGVVNGRTGYALYAMRGDGALIAGGGTFDAPVSIALNPPISESEKWNLIIPSVNYASGSGWEPWLQSYNPWLLTIPRYRYIIPPP